MEPDSVYIKSDYLKKIAVYTKAIVIHLGVAA